MSDDLIDRTTLPIRRQVFKGTAGPTLGESTPDWDLIGHVEPPEGAPNVLLVLIDDAGFGNPSTFGGPIATPNYQRMADAGVKFNLINISNRGTQVWPTGSVYTNLVNQYNVRFESLDGSPLNQQDVLGLYVSLSGDFKICSSELLNMWGGKRAYSLAQGQ